MAGRPRLNSPERRKNILASKARWRDANREYYRLQKRVHAGLPESKAKRRALREQMRPAPSALPTQTPEAPDKTESTLWDYYTQESEMAPGGPEMHFSTPC